PGVRRARDAEADVLRERLPDKMLDLPRDVLERELGAPAFVPARKREDLPDHVPPAYGAGFDRLDVGEALRVRLAIAQRVDGHQDGREDVVEVMRDAARERAD